MIITSTEEQRRYKMEENMLILSGICPICGATLDYAEDARAVKCYACDTVIPTARLEFAIPTAKGACESTSERRIAEGTVSAEAGLAYIGNFFEGYDWASFAESDKLTIPLLDAIAETCKIKFSTDPLTYILNFRRIAVPVLKKIEGLEVLEVEILNKYKSDDISDIFEYFDTYSSITRAIVSSRAALYSELQTNIRLADRFGADRLIIEDLERSLEVFETECAKVNAIEDISEIESYRVAKRAKDELLSSKLRESGIDAQKTYEKAVSLLEAGDVDNALHLFHAVRGFRDSVELIKKHSRTFSFNDEFVEMAGIKYLLIKRDITEFNVLKPDEYDKVSIGALHEIKNGVPEKYPAISDITKIIGCYGSRIFFIRNNEKICCYDTKSDELYANVRDLDTALRGDYVVDEYHPIRFSSDRSKFFICKKLRDEVKRGCFGRKKVKNTVSRQNNYSVVLINMDNVTARTILPAVVDIMDYFNDKLFYTTIALEGGGASFRVCNIDDGTNDSILDAECIIHDVCDGKIIYSTWAPNQYNTNIYSVDLATKEVSTIDVNVKEFYTTYESKVFYTVGSDAYNRLYSANYDGSDRCEIMENAGRICMLRSGWIYYIQGEGRNTCLMKVSSDGSKNMLIASRFAELVKVTNGYIYYINTQNELRIVRTDGNGDKRITDSVSDECIIIDDNSIYCLRSEYVGEKDGNENGMAYSLYSTDLDGKNMKKLVFNVTSIKEYDENTIYLSKKRTADFMVSTPVSKKRENVEKVTADIISYCTFNKKTAAIETVLTLGAPTPSSIAFKSGCFGLGKKKIRNATITEIPATVSYVREGASKEGAVLFEEHEGERKRKQSVIDKKNEKKQRKRELKDAKKNTRRAKQDAKRARKASPKISADEAAE